MVGIYLNLLLPDLNVFQALSSQNEVISNNHFPCYCQLQWLNEKLDE